MRPVIDAAGSRGSFEADAKRKLVPYNACFLKAEVGLAPCGDSSNRIRVVVTSSAVGPSQVDGAKVLALCAKAGHSRQSHFREPRRTP